MGKYTGKKEFIPKLQSSLVDKAYSAKDLQNDFFYSIQSSKAKKPASKNLYQRCVAEIHNFTDSVAEIELLKTFLTFRLGNREKPIRGVNMWTYLLRKLDKAVAECGATRVAIIQQSLDKGWLSFYPVKQFNRGKDKFSEYGVVSCARKEEEELVDEEF